MHCNASQWILIMTWGTWLFMWKKSGPNRKYKVKDGICEALPSEGISLFESQSHWGESISAKGQPACLWANALASPKLKLGFVLIQFRSLPQPTPPSTSSAENLSLFSSYISSEYHLISYRLRRKTKSPCIKQLFLLKRWLWSSP